MTIEVNDFAVIAYEADQAIPASDLVHSESRLPLQTDWVGSRATVAMALQCSC
jgi:hypothetical protein